ncbi:MAG: glycerophosphodiester phosphodiesterase [Calditrichia bacterium]
MEIFAHRGYHHSYPENSIPAIHAAFNKHIYSIEIDVRKCKTGEMVVYHDRNLKRLTGLKKFVINTPYSIIGNLHLKNHEGKMTEYYIPLLREVLVRFGQKMQFILDIKKETWLEDGLENTIVNLLYDLELKDKVIISSFNPFVLKRIHHIEPSIHLGFIINHPLTLKVFPLHFVQSVHCNYQYTDHHLIKEAKDSGKSIFAWTVNDKHLANKLSQQGIVDAIITDNPVEIAGFIGKEEFLREKDENKD